MNNARRGYNHGLAAALPGCDVDGDRQHRSRGATTGVDSIVVIVAPPSQCDRGKDGRLTIGAMG